MHSNGSHIPIDVVTTAKMGIRHFDIVAGQEDPIEVTIQQDGKHVPLNHPLDAVTSPSEPPGSYVGVRHFDILPGQETPIEVALQRDGTHVPVQRPLNATKIEILTTRKDPEGLSGADANPIDPNSANDAGDSPGDMSPPFIYPPFRHATPPLPILDASSSCIKRDNDDKKRIPKKKSRLQKLQKDEEKKKWMAAEQLKEATELRRYDEEEMQSKIRKEKRARNRIVIEGVLIVVN